MFKSTSSMPAAAVAVSKHKNQPDKSDKSSSSPIDVDTIDAYIKKNNTFTLYAKYFLCVIYSYINNYQIHLEKKYCCVLQTGGRQSGIKLESYFK